jgi:hypothetical protein
MPFGARREEPVVVCRVVLSGDADAEERSVRRGA